jgi:GT2 family glycosyltransferase
VDQSRRVHGRGYLPLLKGDFIAASSAVVKRDCLEEVGLFDPSQPLCEDWELWLRISRRYPLRRLPGVLVMYEYASSDKMSARTLAWIEAHDQVIEKAFRLDPSLDAPTRRAIRAHIAYVKGRIYLEAKDDRAASGWFNQALALQPGLLKARVYQMLLSMPALRRVLPVLVSRRLRLPPEEAEKE